MATTNDVICISDDDGDAPRTPPPTNKRRTRAPSFDESLLLSSPETASVTATATARTSTPTTATTPTKARVTASPFASPSAAALKTPPKRSRGKAATRTPPRTASPKKMTAADMERFILGTGGYRTPERQRKRRTSSGRDDVLKPMTPSATVQSSMNASLVFDMVTALSTNDPGVAIAALRSIVVLGKEYPSSLLFEELVDRMLSVEAIAYEDAVSIYASLVFVYDKAATCSCDLEFPHQWEPLANALQDASVLPKTDERWRRLLLVVQFFVYCFLKDFNVCRDRYEKDDGPEWLYHTRLFTLLHTGDAGKSLSGRTTKRATVNRLKIHNNLILQAIGAGLALWQRVYDPPQSESRTSVNNHGDTVDSTLEAKEACVAVVRLIEMLYMCTDQVQNILGRLQAGLLELSRETRAIFAQTLELPDLQTQLATTVLGLTNKSRSKEHEWYECNAMGRILQSINSQTTSLTASDGAATDGYSWSHFDSLVTSSAKNDFTRLLQDIVRLQKEDA